MYSIYKITNNVNQKFYIGFTKLNPPQKRWTRHKQSVRNKRNGKLINALRKYGVENFTFEVLCEGEDEEHGFNVVEPQYIEQLNPHYNTLKGGPNITKYGMNYKTENNSPEEISKKISDGVKRTMTPKMKHRISESMKKYMTPQNREKLSVKMKAAYSANNEIIEKIRGKLKKPKSTRNGIPVTEEDKMTTSILLRMPNKLLKEIDDVCDETYCTRSELIRQSIQKYLRDYNYRTYRDENHHESF